MSENNFDKESLLKYFKEEYWRFIIGITYIRIIRNTVLRYIIRKKLIYSRVKLKDQSQPEEQINKLMGELFYDFAFRNLKLSYKTHSKACIFNWYKLLDPQVTLDSEEIHHIYVYSEYYFDR